MFSSDEYFWGWVLYAMASLGLLVVWWFMTRWIPQQIIRNTLRVIVAAALLMPFPVEEGSAFLAPAIIMTFVEGLFVRGGSFDRAGIPLAIAIGCAAMFYIGISILWHIFLEKRFSSTSDVDDPEVADDVKRTAEKIETDVESTAENDLGNDIDSVKMSDSLSSEKPVGQSS